MEASFGKKRQILFRVPEKPQHQACSYIRLKL
jgi:hypothetical protein